MTDTQASQAYVLSASAAEATAVDASQSYVMTAATAQAVNVQASQGFVNAASVGTNQVESSQSYVLVAAQGRVGQPQMVAWTFTLDGHDFYALRLGDDTTFVYDQNTQQWAEWGEDFINNDATINTLGRWGLGCGLNWQGIGALAYTKGSNIVAGDDTCGAIYVFDPTDDEDYKYTQTGSMSFHRIAQGQLVMAGRDASPVWGVILSGSVGEQWTGDLVNVELQTSDDMGNSYQSCGIITVPQNQYSFRLDWNSLGSMYNPGRLFKIIDDGALVRIDSLKAYDRDSQ